jgi:hypothetical protein
MHCCCHFPIPITALFSDDRHLEFGRLLHHAVWRFGRGEAQLPLRRCAGETACLENKNSLNSLNVVKTRVPILRRGNISMSMLTMEKGETAKIGSR